MFDPMAGRGFAGQMPNQPLSSYAPNNALAGYGMGFQKPMAGMPPAGSVPAAPMAPPQPPVQPGMIGGDGSALGGYGPSSPLTFGQGGLPQQFQDYNQQLQDWRGLRPDRPDFRQMRQGMQTGGAWDPAMRDKFMGDRMGYRNQVQDWRAQRPQFAGWR